MTLPLIWDAKSGRIIGGRPHEVENYHPGDPMRQIELASIRHFVQAHRDLIKGERVLDFGAGKPGTCRLPQPYRDLVDAAEYVPFDKGDPDPEGQFDAILCTQVFQYCGPVKLLEKFMGWLKPGGGLVMTYPTNWDEVDSDFWRYTKAGMEYLLRNHAQVEVLAHELRAVVQFGPGVRFPLGYGVACRRR